jgi:hypothetical protein
MTAPQSPDTHQFPVSTRAVTDERLLCGLLVIVSADTEEPLRDDSKY